ncbi:MAG: DegT/DnrJ/EryC1/StrS family aminotransferase [Patescibacteria group bacterium]|nr:MAG: DegT/DnrJ/EryC1/StrS family aminotransferase [Patescibacteria group bacterium]
MNFFSQQLSKKKTDLLLKRIGRVVAAEQFINGPEVGDLERKLSDFFGVEAVTCNSGTDALMIGLKALGIGPGDEVITTAFTYFATIEAIAAVGAKPVLVDIDPQTFNIDASQIEKKITKKTRAVLVVHLYGLACDVAEVARICKKHHLKLVEDCAQSYGAKSGGKLTGTFGDVGCFSFFPTKNLGAFGDGGAVTIRSKAVLARFKLLKNHGQPRKYVHQIIGGNSRLDTIQAAVLLEKIAWLEEDLAVRRARAQSWFKKYRNHPNVMALPEQEGHTYNVFTLLVHDRKAFVKELEREGIPSAIYYDVPVYKQPAYVGLFGKHAPLPHSEFAAKHVISLPIH